ncbi:uncharacterized protein STEHIDRAFT_163950 [Stereum hirsutum FP-91666 SS1]|uniref:Uncharacterized protein n=1 Tax=Stereum hirsutum (strain FP-91666) TaxID=721885 RepID=R7RVP8_STEHR|nr:uncharacterized protein STEHIDRAFT_163950 [Stereum hirsutum FP-91666 SS1]EIM79189.1 hypothetical protein STEHIDRAFT_163950 [Stereum hirsutum FP-91666 SS1]
MPIIGENESFYVPAGTDYSVLERIASVLLRHLRRTITATSPGAVDINRFGSWHIDATDSMPWHIDFIDDMRGPLSFTHNHASDGEETAWDDILGPLWDGLD